MKFDQLTEHAEGKLLSGIVDRVGHVVINNPERHNAISMAMYQAGAAEVNRMGADPEARLLVIRGADDPGILHWWRHGAGSGL